VFNVQPGKNILQMFFYRLLADEKSGRNLPVGATH